MTWQAPARPRYTGFAGGVDINTETINNGINYGVGYGMGDFNRMKAGGYDGPSVIKYLSTWGKPIAPAALDATWRYTTDQQNADAAAKRQYDRDQATQKLLSDAINMEPPPPPDPPVINIPPPPPTVPAPMSISGNAAGVKRKKSTSEQSGRSTSGTNQFNRSMYINPVAPLTNLNL